MTPRLLLCEPASLVAAIEIGNRYSGQRRDNDDNLNAAIAEIVV